MFVRAEKGYILNKHNAQLELLLDLIDAGYRNAYVSVMDVFDKKQKPIKRIEIVLFNAGRLCLYQTFEDIYDMQIPQFTVYYYFANNKNIRMKISDKKLLNRAIGIVYKTQKYFEQNPEHTITDDGDLINKIHNNKKMAMKLYKQHMKNISHFFRTLSK